MADSIMPHVYTPFSCLQFLAACLSSFLLPPPSRSAESVTLRMPPEAVFRQVLENAADGQTVTIETPPEGWTIRLSTQLAVKNVNRFSLISKPGPTYLVGDQLAYINCSLIRHENFAHRHHGGDDFATIAREIMKSDGLDGRGLVINDCQDVTVSRCSFAICADDMTGCGGLATRRINYERCLFSMPVGVYGQGLLIWTSKDRIAHIDNLARIDRCVFSNVTYRTPKLEGGFCLVTNCVIAGNMYPIELREPDVVFAGCMFAPDARMGRRVIAHTAKPADVKRLGLFGNWYRGTGPSSERIDHVPNDQWSVLVGSVRGVIDKQNVMPRAGETLRDEWNLKMTPEIARGIINEAGPSVTDDIDRLAKSLALRHCGLEQKLTPARR